jgi:hypothetical protein
MSCVPSGTHPWYSAISIPQLRAWIDAILAGRAFAATEVRRSSIVDHDTTTDWAGVLEDQDTLCATDGSVYLMDPVDLSYHHCDSGRSKLNKPPPPNQLTACRRPCTLRLVRTTKSSLQDDNELRDLPVLCNALKQPFSFTGRTRGMALLGTQEKEVIPCAGGVPEWRSSTQLAPCAQQLCLAQPPVEFRTSLRPICDLDGNSALATGQSEGWLESEGRWVPVFFDKKLQVIPCDGGQPRWLYERASRACTADEVARCRGLESTPRILSPRVFKTARPAAGAPASTSIFAVDVHSLMGLNDDDYGDE